MPASMQIRSTFGDQAAASHYHLALLEPPIICLQDCPWTFDSGNSHSSAFRGVLYLRNLLQLDIRQSYFPCWFRQGRRSGCHSRLYCGPCLDWRAGHRMMGTFTMSDREKIAKGS
jgi:hypothetical protein